jgi:alpha-tubulin suppressor-like RCC1 family protein
MARASMRPYSRLVGLSSSRIVTRTVLPLLALSAAACGSEDTPVGPSAPEAELATAGAALPSFVQITVGSGHTCAVTSGGLIYCWGDNSSGQLGDGTTTDRLLPVRVRGGTLRFRRVTAGSLHTCAETRDGKAYCWGNNAWGQLGTGDNANRLTPTTFTIGLTFRRVEAGSQHTCGVTTGSDAYCWGNNSSGQLGDPSSAGFTRTSPVRVSNSPAFTAIDPGASHTCALTTSSRVFCWGNNSFGQLGNGTTSAPHLSPAIVSGNRLYKQVSTGSSHSCALGTDDKAYCWGDNFSGAIGDGTTTRRLVPTAVSGARRYRGLSAGGANNCATDLASRSWCWGNNAFGGLGDGTTTTRLVPVATKGGLTFARLNAGQHSCGVTAGGQAYCWGFNGFGEIGDGTRINRLRPRLVGGS